jgi:hypothetical protein
MTFLTILLVIYGLIGLLNFGIYLILFMQDCSTPKTDRSSWIVLGVASLFWPVVLPLSCLERRAKMRSLHTRWDNIKQQNSCAVPLI